MSPEQFGSYRLVERIGRGSAGTVFVGEYGSLRRPIAIKVLHEHLVADGSVERMLAEARALSMLDHPGIVKVLDCGMTDDGRAYIVMEYLAGELLHQRLRRGPLGDDRVVLFARQLASALEVAHAHGIIHRDVKPENAFVIADPDVPGGERVKLIDFGIAKCDDHEQTDAGVVLGTPAYMAPEQFAASRHIDHRADIYALGVVMYTMATGTLPFVGIDTEELRAEHSFCLPTPATAAGVSPRLSEIIDRCLAKQPHERYASMAALGAALRELEVDGVTDHARGGAGDSNGAALDELDIVAASPLPIDVRSRMPWRSVLGVVAALTVALGSVRFDGGDSREASPSRARVVEGDDAARIEAAAIERHVEPNLQAELEPELEPELGPRLEPKLDRPPRRSERARQRSARRESTRATHSPATAAGVEGPSDTAGVRAPPTKREEEDYASVTPPTLY